MTPLVIVSLAILVVGFLVYVPASGRFMRDFKGRYGRVPPRSWILRSVDDPEIERWRRYAAVSLVVNVIGVMLVFAASATR